MLVQHRPMLRLEQTRHDCNVKPHHACAALGEPNLMRPAETVRRGEVVGKAVGEARARGHGPRQVSLTAVLAEADHGALRLRRCGGPSVGGVPALVGGGRAQRLAKGADRLLVGPRVEGRVEKDASVVVRVRAVHVRPVDADDAPQEVDLDRAAVESGREILGPRAERFDVRLRRQHHARLVLEAEARADDRRAEDDEREDAQERAPVSVGEGHVGLREEAVEEALGRAHIVHGQILR
mmetsp:Transcript_20518/g.63796  ORF Transcript_20518/g.63796 Transcript_20518/m.63796 type:complete len:238 (-) Transcript_20518:17-730(-)